MNRELTIHRASSQLMKVWTFSFCGLFILSLLQGIFGQFGNDALDTITGVACIMSIWTPVATILMFSQIAIKSEKLNKVIENRDMHNISLCIMIFLIVILYLGVILSAFIDMKLSSFYAVLSISSAFVQSFLIAFLGKEFIEIHL